MEDRENNLSLVIKWKRFLNVLFNPFVFLLLLSTIALIRGSTKIEDDTFSTIVTLIITLLSGVLGIVLQNRWTQYNEHKMLIARGRAAIRSLKLILVSLSDIENRTKSYIANLDNKSHEYKSLKISYEELISRCCVLQEGVVNSIENWTDIVPDIGEYKTQIGIISESYFKAGEYERTMKELSNKLTSISETNSKEKKELQRSLEVTQKELAKALENAKTAEIKINTSILSGVTYGASSMGGTLSYGNSPLFRFKPCIKCGKYFPVFENDTSQICKECGASGGNDSIMVATTK